MVCSTVNSFWFVFVSEIPSILNIEEDLGKDEPNDCGKGGLGPPRGKIFLLIVMSLETMQDSQEDIAWVVAVSRYEHMPKPLNSS